MPQRDDLATQPKGRPNLGGKLRALRRENGWTLEQLSGLTGLAISTLSKVERGQLSLTYDNLFKLARGLDMDIAEMFGNSDPRPVTGRRSITRRGDTENLSTSNYDYHYHSTDLKGARMVPIYVEVKARNIAEFGELLRHGGEEFIYVIDGTIEVHTEFYEPVTLTAGESIYLDSNMGHAYVSVSPGSAKVLGVCSGTVPRPAELLQLSMKLGGADRAG